MSTLSDNPRLCRYGDIYGIYPYVSRMTVYAHNQGKNLLKYQTRVYNFKKEGLLREFFQQKIVKIGKDIQADLIIAIPSSDSTKIGILPEIFGAIIIREKTVKQIKYNHKKNIDNPADSCSISIDIKNKKILLIDDICTTGKTLRAFRSYLEDNGGHVIGMLACGLKYSVADYIPSGFIDGTMPDEIGTNLPDKIKEDTPFTISEYARMHNISHTAVRKAIESGRLISNGKVGHDCRVWGKMKKNNQKSEDDRIKNAKIEKLQLETALKRQQLEENRRSIFREVSAAYIEATKTAFAPLHAEYVKLRLNDEQLAQLREIGQTVIQSFERLMNEYIESYLDTGSIKPC